MEALAYMLSWGSPVGLGLFLFFLLAGMGVFFLGAARLNDKKDKGE